MTFVPSYRKSVTDAEYNDSVNRFYLSQGWKPESTHDPDGRKMNRYIYNFDC
jgi:hypothetical protein